MLDGTVIGIAAEGQLGPLEARIENGSLWPATFLTNICTLSPVSEEVEDNEETEFDLEARIVTTGENLVMVA